MTHDISKAYKLVDTTIGARLLFSFIVSPLALQRRLRPPWHISSPPAAYAPDSLSENLPNLTLVFNDLLLNQDGQGRVQADTSACYVGFNIPVANPETGEHGMFHFRIFTNNPHAVPGRYRDALLAQVRHEQRIIGGGTSLIVMEAFELHPAVGGIIELQLTYERGPLVRLVADSPNFPLWAALDPSIQRIYQEDKLLEVIRNDATGINRVQHEMFRLTVPELADLFDGSERLVAIQANPQYARKTFSSGVEYEER